MLYFAVIKYSDYLVNEFWLTYNEIEKFYSIIIGFDKDIKVTLTDSNYNVLINY